MFDTDQWQLGFQTGLNSPIMREMSPADLLREAKNHLTNSSTSHDKGMANACEVLAYIKLGGMGYETQLRAVL